MSTPSLSLPADRARPLALTFPRPELSVLLAADVMGARGRAVIVAGAVAALPFAPTSWSLQTPSYAASGTFPAGGPATTGFGAPGGPRDQRGQTPLGPGGQTPLAGRRGQIPPVAGDGRGVRPRPGGLGGQTPPMAAGGPFGGDTSSLSAALAYAVSQGGGTVAVASQSGAAGSLITSGADVAALGGFSGRESQVSVAWLADAVDDRRLRWVLVAGAGGMGKDGRIGASEVMAAVAQIGTPVSSVDGLYDLQGAADALRAFTR